MARLGIDPRDPTDYTGLKVNAVPLVSAPREPLPSDNRFPLFTEWRIEANPSTGVEGDFWKLVSFSGGDALWRKIGEGGSGSLISLSDTSDTIVYSDATGNIKLEAGAGITVTSTPASNKLTFALAGGGTAVDQINVDANTGPGTDPVVPTAAGEVTVAGAVVAAHSVPVETHSRAANAYNVEVQVASDRTGAPGNKLDAGLCSFDDTQFTVDADGYVTLSALAAFNWVEETTTSRNLSNNQGVIANNGSLVTLTLPTTAALGTVIRVAGKGSGLWTIAQNASQRIHYGAIDTTIGIGGSLSAGGQFDCVELLCTTANTRWTVLSSQGSLIAV